MRSFASLSEDQVHENPKNESFDLDQGKAVRYDLKAGRG
jgi:hypothetical protein